MSNEHDIGSAITPRPAVEKAKTIKVMIHKNSFFHPPVSLKIGNAKNRGNLLYNHYMKRYLLAVFTVDDAAVGLQVFVNHESPVPFSKITESAFSELTASQSRQNKTFLESLGEKEVSIGTLRLSSNFESVSKNQRKEASFHLEFLGNLALSMENGDDVEFFVDGKKNNEVTEALVHILKSQRNTLLEVAKYFEDLKARQAAA